MTLLWIILTIVAIVIVLKLVGKWKKGCGPKCRLPQKQKPTSLKTEKDRKREKEEIKKRIERQKGKSVKDSDLFSDFIEKKKEKK